MKKKRTEYDSTVDALISISKRLSVYEAAHNLESETFFDQYSKGKIEDSKEFVEWSNDYQHYLSIRFEIESVLQNAA